VRAHVCSGSSDLYPRNTITQGNHHTGLPSVCTAHCWPDGWTREMGARRAQLALDRIVLRMARERMDRLRDERRHSGQ
jgi:hypothetical protein